MKIKVKLGNLDEAVNALEDYQKSLNVKAKVLIEKLAEVGFDVADIRFKQAQYDGVNDVVVQSPQWVEDNKIVLLAKGNAVTFIEFGAGVRYTEVHPLALEKGAIRGAYGKGKGKNKSWTYYGEPGTNGKIVRVSDKGMIIRTEGNPPARAMYEAVKTMREKILEIAKEVFK